MGHIWIISKGEESKLDLVKIPLGKVGHCPEKTGNKVAPGAGGYSGAFYDIFRCNFKFILIGAIHQIPQFSFG